MKGWTMGLLLSVANGSQSAPPPYEYVDAHTGHRVYRLSRAEGSFSSFYFHQNAFTAKGDKMVLAGAVGGKRRLYAVDLRSPDMHRITDRDSVQEVVAPRRREVFYLSGQTVCGTHIDTGETHEICTIPEEWLHGTGFTVNADETLLAGIYTEGIASHYERPRSEWFVSIFEAKLPNRIYTVDLKKGKTRVVYRENAWLGHIQFSPTDSKFLLFCREGPWERLDRIWLLGLGEKTPTCLHQRTMDKEIAGHEFWDPKGERVWFDLQRPMWKKLSLASVNISTGEETSFPLSPEHWSIHYNISRDGSLFCGDGGASAKGLSTKETDGIYLYRPRGEKLEVEKLCGLEGHDYALEPNARFSPDGKNVIFRSNMHGTNHVYAVEVEGIESQVGNFFPFLDSLASTEKRSLSFVKTQGKEGWQEEGRAKMAELLLYDPSRQPIEEEILETVKKQGYTRYTVRYALAPDRFTEAFLFIPDKLSGPAGGVIAIHDHGGYYYHGKEKITETDNPCPVLREHIESSYGGRPYADELARRGFVVLVPDGFYFGSQRLDPSLLPRNERKALDGLEPGSDAYIRAFQPLAGRHEEILAKSLFTAGTTWPGVLFQGDRASVDYLLTRPEVDPNRIGCVGLSIGGFRSAHLFGLDPRIKAGIVVGWMTTYGSLLYDHLRCHTWMIYVPGQLNWLDLPDVVTLNAPRPLMVIHCLKDQLFTWEGMTHAEKIIADVYEKMDASDRFRCLYADEPHSFRLQAQEEAITWLEKWLAR